MLLETRRDQKLSLPVSQSSISIQQAEQLDESLSIARSRAQFVRSRGSSRCAWWQAPPAADFSKTPSIRRSRRFNLATIAKGCLPTGMHVSEYNSKVAGRRRCRATCAAHLSFDLVGRKCLSPVESSWWSVAPNATCFLTIVSGTVLMFY